MITDLESLVEPVTRGDPESPLRWTAGRARAAHRRPPARLAAREGITEAELYAWRSCAFAAATRALAG